VGARSRVIGCGPLVNVDNGLEADAVVWSAVGGRWAGGPAVGGPVSGLHG